MKIPEFKFLLLGFCWIVFLPFPPAFLPAGNAEKQARELFSRFAKEYAEQPISDFGVDYKENFRNIASLEKIEVQQQFFERYNKELRQLKREQLSKDTRLDYDHLKYELDLNLERLRLEERFRKRKDHVVPETGLAALIDGNDWYKFYVRYYTSTNISPDELMKFGEQEVARVQKEIRKLRFKMGYSSDSAGFYKHLQSPEFYLRSEKAVENHYQEIQKTVVKNLQKLFLVKDLPMVQIKPWPEAGPFTPPGYYQPANNQTGATFHYSFYGQKHNIRATDWMFLHEAILCHHYQAVLRNRLPKVSAFSEHFYYPANTEGWAAYVENYGKELGLYQTEVQELGKWEWDLVRSARVVIDVGIHSQGWSKESAISYWKKQVPGQEEIAEREVTRCLNWAA
jgi:uncharacterized protein (DUF885 family)